MFRVSFFCEVLGTCGTLQLTIFQEKMALVRPACGVKQVVARLVSTLEARHQVKNEDISFHTVTVWIELKGLTEDSMWAYAMADIDAFYASPYHANYAKKFLKIGTTNKPRRITCTLQLFKKNLK